MPYRSTLQLTSLGRTRITDHNLPCRNITVNSHFQHPVSFRSSGPVQFESWFWQCGSVLNPILFVHIILILNFLLFFSFVPSVSVCRLGLPESHFLHNSWRVTGLHEVLAHIFLCWDCNFSISYFATRTPLVVPFVPTVTSWLPGTFLPPGQRVLITAWGKGEKKKPADWCSAI